MSGFVLNSYILNTGYFTSRSITVQNTVTDPADAAANINFSTDGTGTVLSGVTTAFTWWSSTVTDIGAGKYATATISSTSGSPTTTGNIPTNGSRVEMNVARSIGISKTVVGTATSQFTIDVYDQPSGGNLIGTIVFNATAIVSAAPPPEPDPPPTNDPYENLQV